MRKTGVAIHHPEHGLLYQPWSAKSQVCLGKVSAL